MSIITCGWGSRSEKKSANGKKGDQDGKEVLIGQYYDFNQDKLIRFRNPAKGKKAAKAMKMLCQNNNIGYGQTDRKTLYNECDRVGWDMKRINEIRSCNGDCSEVCACAINFAFGKPIMPWTTTTRDFEYHTSVSKPKRFKSVKKANQPRLVKANVTRPKKIPVKDRIVLHPGDMPLKAGKHIVMVVEVV